MFKRFIWLLSLCIMNKDKRHIFRERCFKYKANLERIDTLKEQLNVLSAKLCEHHSCLSQQSRFIAKQGGVLFVDCKRSVLQTLIEEEKLGDEHKKNMFALYRLLDEDAKIHLDEILERQMKCTHNNIISFDELYASGHDKKQWRDLQEFEQQIVPCCDYFSYKHYKLPVDSFQPEVFLYKHGLTRLKTFGSIGDRVIFDVGGFVADTILIMREFSNNDIYSFEPDPVNYNLALRTLELNKNILNKGGNVILENIALGDSNGNAKIITPLYNGNYIAAASRLVGEDVASGADVVVRTLDSYVTEHNLQIGLIKVDIEGYEQRFLAGALETIKTQKPILLISIYHNRNDFYQIKPFIEELDLGYKFDFFQGVSRWIKNDIMLLCEVY